MIIDVIQHVDNSRVVGRNLDRDAAARQIGTAVSRAPKGTGAAPGIATLTLTYSILAPSPPQTAPRTRLRVNFDGCLSAGPGLRLSETLWWTVRYEIRLARWERISKSVTARRSAVGTSARVRQRAHHDDGLHPLASEAAEGAKARLTGWLVTFRVARGPLLPPVAARRGTRSDHAGHLLVPWTARHPNRRRRCSNSQA
jgi:hypothetical protein